MSFMEPQVTGKTKWYQVDTDNGIVSYPADNFTTTDVALENDVEDEDVNTVVGYGARMSAPGYLDCTEWVVFDTAEEAEAYLAEEYSDDSTEAGGW